MRARVALIGCHSVRLLRDTKGRVDLSLFGMRGHPSQGGVVVASGRVTNDATTKSVSMCTTRSPGLRIEAWSG